MKYSTEITGITFNIDRTDRSFINMKFELYDIYVNPFFGWRRLGWAESHPNALRQQYLRGAIL